MKNMIILIPPSEGKQPLGSHSPLKKIAQESQGIIKSLHNYNGDVQKLLGVKDKALKEAVTINREILTAPTMPAIERYTGVVYNAIDYPSLKKSSQQFFHDHVRIVSAVFGLVKPQQLIPNYKLKIDKLKAQQHWLDANTHALKNTFVIDLLPQAHKKAIAYDDGIFVDFLMIKNKKRVSAGHHGKHIKGRFVRWLCENKIKNPKHFSQFNEDGFRWYNDIFIKD